MSRQCARAGARLAFCAQTANKTSHIHLQQATAKKKKKKRITRISAVLVQEKEGEKGQDEASQRGRNVQRTIAGTARRRTCASESTYDNRRNDVLRGGAGSNDISGATRD